MKVLSRIAVVCLVTFFASVFVCAQSSNSSSMIESGVVPDDPARTAGFECVVEMRGSVRPGYVALHFSFSLPVASTSERTLLARVRPQAAGMIPQRNAIEVELPLVIEQDATSFEVVRFVPKWMSGSSYSIEFFEDGRPLEGYSLELGGDLSGRRMLEQAIEQEVSSQWLFLEPTVVDRSADGESRESPISKIQDWINFGRDDSASDVFYRTGRGFRGRSPQSYLARGGNVSVLSEESWPTDWREFQKFNVIVLNASTFERLQTNGSPQYLALKHWLLMGGNVAVRGLSSKLELSTFLSQGSEGVSRTNGAQKRLESVVSDYSARMAKFAEAASALEAAIPDTQAGFRVDVEGAGPRSLAPEDQAILADLKSSRVSIQCREVGMGRVVAFRDDFAESRVGWGIANDVLNTSSSPVLRRGVDPLFGDARFRRWLIPGVAQPPVYTFMGLLTMFVMLVGPVAYRYTTKHGRSYLMFAIAPVLAVFTTVSMFAYGIVSDGFGTVARIRQITWVDGKTGDAVTRNRGTYFAGIRPANGLRFDAEAEVMWYPDVVDASPNEVSQMQLPPMGIVTVDSVDQRFSSSFLPSRQQRQFIVHQAVPGFGTLSARRVESGADEEKATSSVVLEIKNSLSMDLKQVVVCDAKGDFWSVDKIASNAVVRVDSQVLPKDRSKLLGDLYNVQRMLEENSGAARSQQQSKSLDLISTLNQMDSDASRQVTDGTFEQWAREHLQLGGSLEPGMFVGLATIDSRFIATEDTELVDSIHFVIGTMP